MLRNRRVLPFDKKLNDENIQKEIKRREVQRSRRQKALDARRKRLNDNMEDWTDQEIIEYIKDNFYEITGVRYRDIFADYVGEREDSPIFDEKMVYESYPGIEEVLRNRFKKTRREIDDLLYLIDDYFSEDWEANRGKVLDAKRKARRKAKTKDKVQDEEIIQLTEDEIKVLKKVLPNLVALIEGEVEVEIELDESEFDIELEVDKDQFDQLTNEDDKLEDQDELGKIMSDPKKKEALKEVLNDSDDKKLNRLERRKAGDSAIEPLKLKDEVRNRINNKIQDEKVVKPDFTTRFEESINKLNDESTVKEQVDFSSRWN